MTKQELKMIEKMNEGMDTSLSVANEARISNPSKEVENSLLNFMHGRFEQLNKDQQYLDLIRMYVRGRMSEATFQELIQLLNQQTIANNQAVSDFMKMFDHENSEATIIETLKKNNEIDSNASQLFDSIEHDKSKEVLQAVGYLTQVMSSLTSQDAEEEKNG